MTTLHIEYCMFILYISVITIFYFTYNFTMTTWLDTSVLKEITWNFTAKL